MDEGDDEYDQDEKYEEDDHGGPPGGHDHPARLAGEMSARFDDLEDLKTFKPGSCFCKGSAPKKHSNNIAQSWIVIYP